MNELLCGHCRNFDPILGPGEKKKRRGMCIPRSVYPTREGPGQVFPPGVRRAPAGELAKPFIVKVDQLVGPCEQAKAADFDQADEKKRQQVTASTRPDGKRVHS